MTYYYIHVAKGRGGGDGRFSLLFYCSELATLNQRDLQECGDVCACVFYYEVVSAENTILLFNLI